MPASNYSVQPRATDSEGRLRPSMKQEDHPEHNMPASEHEGSVLSVNRASKSGSERKDQTRYGDDSSKDTTTPMTNETNYFIDRDK